MENPRECARLARRSVPNLLKTFSFQFNYKLGSLENIEFKFINFSFCTKQNIGDMRICLLVINNNLF